MKFISKVTLFISLFSLAGFIYASPITECPSVNAIKSLGLTNAEIFIGDYVVSNTSSYGTRHKWEFGLGFVKADSKSEAIKIGNKWLSSLSGNPTPAHVGGHAAQCLYTIQQGEYASASTETDA